MDYEKKYKEALERASRLRVQNPFDTVSQMMEHVFPELAESEDERIMKGLLKMFNHYVRNNIELIEYDLDKDMALAWLEKQGEQKLANFYCQEHCKGFQETGKCFADGDCKAKTIAETVHAGTENILEELADRIEKAEIVNVRQVLEWIEEQTKE